MGNWQSRETLSPHRISLSWSVETNLLSTLFSERPRTEWNQALVVLATLSGVKALAELASEQKVLKFTNGNPRQLRADAHRYSVFMRPVYRMDMSGKMTHDLRFVGLREVCRNVSLAICNLRLEHDSNLS